MSQYDTYSLYDFLVHTPEGGLRKILIDNQHMTPLHLSLLLKVVKGSSPEEFADYFNNQSLPKIRMSPAESKLREKFWGDCLAVFESRGLLQPAVAVKEVKEAA